MTETPETEPRAVVSRTPGEILKQAREGKDLSVAAIATQLNLDLRTIDALESGDHSKLPAPIFVRGYLRGYARLVGVPEEVVLSAYQAQAPQEPTPRTVGMTGGAGSMRPAFSVPTIPWRGLMLLILLVAAAGLAFRFGPQLVNRFMPGVAPEGASSSAPSLALPVPGREDTAMPEQPLSAPAASSGLELPLPEPAPRADEDLQPPAVEEPEPATSGDADFGMSAAPTAAEPESVPEPEPEPAASVPAPAPVADQVRLDFSFTADSWVEVRGADRSKLLFGLLRKGDSRSVTGTAPISVLLGNSDAVDMKVNGAVFDHARYARNNIARFNVPAQP